MCGRFTLQHTWAEVHAAMSLIPASAAGRNDPPRYNITPTQEVGFIARGRDGEVIIRDGRWWLVPFWAKELPKHPLFNARSETADRKSSFREAFKSKRCLIPASSYYEWTKGDDGGKDPHNIRLTGNEVFFFAGLWAHNDALNVTSCTILTAAAAPEIESLHDRMPILLDATVWHNWINPETDVASAKSLLDHNRGSELISYRVARDVNPNKAKGSELIQPLEQ